MVVILLVGEKVDFLEQLLLGVLEFPDHCDSYPTSKREQGNAEYGREYILGGVKRQYFVPLLGKASEQTFMVNQALSLEPPSGIS